MSNVSTPEPHSLENTEAGEYVVQTEDAGSIQFDHILRLPPSGLEEEAIAQWRKAFAEGKSEVLRDSGNTVVCTCRPGPCSQCLYKADSTVRADWSGQFESIASKILISAIVGSIVAIGTAFLVKFVILTVGWLF